MRRRQRRAGVSDDSGVSNWFAAIELSQDHFDWSTNRLLIHIADVPVDWS